MSLPRPSGLKAPSSKIGRPSALPSGALSTPAKAGVAAAPASGTPAPSGIPSKAQSAIAKSARAAGLVHPSAERYASDVASHIKGPESDAGSGSIPTDDYKIGDRVWVSGTKPGIIAFIGETQFAPGDWAGVVLDEPIGKNDGSVMGVRYFQCEMKRGVFSRLTKLTLTQRPDNTDAGSMNSASGRETHAVNGIPSVMTTSLSSPTSRDRPTTPTARPTTPRLGLGGSHVLSGSSSSLNKASSPAASSMHAAAARAGFKIGERVLVSGSKSGILKYVGETDFAKGMWAGVELDEALGKNDGAVAGKRYFDCKPLHGLFAPVHKVARVSGSNVMTMSTPSPMSRSMTGLRNARERSGSQESVSSISSSASSVSRSRNKVGQRPSTLNLSATTAALQKALKEKEEHIEQLLRERDLERSEVARAAAQVDEAEGQLTNIKSEQDRFRMDAEELISRLRQQIADLEKDKEELHTKLEDEQRRVEDLQFQIEEEVICKDDLESTKEEDAVRLRELEKNYAKEKKRADAMDIELQTLRAAQSTQHSKLKEQAETQNTYLDQIEELTHKLSQAENRIHQFESSRLEDGAKSSQVSLELSEKGSRIAELEEQLSAQRKEMKHAQDQLQEVKEELTASNSRCKKLQEVVDGLSSKVHSLEESHTITNDELRSAKSQSADLQRQLAESKEKNADLLDDRNKLEQQIAELMKNSGDSSNQLSSLHQQLADKSRKIEELQNDLSSSSQQIARLSESIEEAQRVNKKEKEELVHKFKEQLKSNQSQLEEVQLELEKSRSKLIKVTEEAEVEKKEEIGRREGEIMQLKQKLEAQAAEVTNQQVQTQAHKEYLDKLTLELEAIKYEKEKAEKAQKRLEGERDAANTELIQARVELTKIKSQSADVTKQQAAFQERIDDLQAEKEVILRSKQEVEKLRDDLKAEKEKLKSDKDSIQKEWVSLKAEIQKRDIQLEEAQKEHMLQLKRLRKQTEEKQEEIMQRSQTESDMLNEELQGSKRTLEEMRKTLREVESELAKVKAELEMSQRVADQHKKLEEQKAQLLKEMEAMRESHRQQQATAETERVALSNRLNTADQVVQQQQQVVETQKIQLASLEAEKTKLFEAKSLIERDHRSQLTRAQELAEKVNRLEASLSKASQPVAAAGDTKEMQLLQEKRTMKHEVEFLNSVIVDLQTKNLELSHRLQAMEQGAFNGSPEADHTPLRSRPAPRLFCDICDVFDQHDTDDCPKQAMSESPPPSLHHGERKSTRPYCDICEYFIDPNAAEKHTHSKDIEIFFKQHIGFSSDEDIEDLRVTPSRLPDKRQEQQDQRHLDQQESADSGAGSSPDAAQSWEVGLRVKEESVTDEASSETHQNRDARIPFLCLSEAEDITPCPESEARAGLDLVEEAVLEGDHEFIQDVDIQNTEEEEEEENKDYPTTASSLELSEESVIDRNFAEFNNSEKQGAEKGRANEELKEPAGMSEDTVLDDNYAEENIAAEEEKEAVEEKEEIDEEEEERGDEKTSNDNDAVIGRCDAEQAVEDCERGGGELSAESDVVRRSAEQDTENSPGVTRRDGDVHGAETVQNNALQTSREVQDKGHAPLISDTGGTLESPGYTSEPNGGVLQSRTGSEDATADHLENNTELSPGVGQGVKDDRMEGIGADADSEAGSKPGNGTNPSASDNDSERENRREEPIEGREGNQATGEKNENHKDNELGRTEGKGDNQPPENDQTKGENRSEATRGNLPAAQSESKEENQAEGDFVRLAQGKDNSRRQQQKQQQQDEKKDKVKKRASAGATLGGGNASSSAGAPPSAASERPESCSVS